MDAPDPRIIMVFARTPVLGTVKTRLAATLGDRAALRLYRCFILDLLQTLDGLALPMIICHTPPNAGPVFRQWLPGRYDLMPQEGLHLGQRMAAAFRHVFANGYREAVLIGSDLPDLPADHVGGAFHQLRTADAVVGPAADGGYYLIGFRWDTFCPVLFESPSWGTHRVLKETLTIAKAEGLRVTLLAEWTDIDNTADLAAFLQRHQGNRAVAPRTLACLDEIKKTYDFN